MRKVTLIRGARQLLTLRGPSGPRRGADLRNLGIIQDGAVLVANGLIVEVGPSRRLENLAQARGAEAIDATGCVIMPGFVDSHVPVARGPSQELSPRVLKTLARHVLEEAVRWGTTAVEIKSSQGLTESMELKFLRVHAALRELPVTVVSTFLANGLAATTSGQRLLPMVRRRRLAEFAELPCDGNAFDPAPGCHFLALARDLGLGCKVSAGQHSYPGTIAFAIGMQAASVNNIVEATERDAMLLSQSQTIVTLSPGIAFHPEAQRYAPARMLIDHGAAVALSSGFHPPNMQLTMAVACGAMNITPAEAIAAATINAAHALGRAGRIGSIEAGKSADLAILGVPDYREVPEHLGVNLATLVMSRGTVLVERSEVKWPAADGH
jgi:imidazolonepropionase